MGVSWLWNNNTCIYQMKTGWFCNNGRGPLWPRLSCWQRLWPIKLDKHTGSSQRIWALRLIIHIFITANSVSIINQILMIGWFPQSNEQSVLYRGIHLKMVEWFYRLLYEYFYRLNKEYKGYWQTCRSIITTNWFLLKIAIKFGHLTL